MFFKFLLVSVHHATSQLTFGIQIRKPLAPGFSFCMTPICTCTLHAPSPYMCGPNSPESYWVSFVSRSAFHPPPNILSVYCDQSFSLLLSHFLILFLLACTSSTCSYLPTSPQPSSTTATSSWMRSMRGT